MKLRVFVLLCSLVPAVALVPPTISAQDDLAAVFTARLTEKDIAYTFLQFSGVVIRTTKGTIVIDPAELLTPADLEVLKRQNVSAVLYTHRHGDHYTLRSALAIFAATNATIVAESTVAADLAERGSAIPPAKLIAAAAGGTVKVGDFTIAPVTGQHIGPITLYQITSGDLTIFHAGDSAYVPLKAYPSALAFLPTGDPSPTASPKAALSMALDLKPRHIVTIHGSTAQNDEFKRSVTKVLPGTAVEFAAARQSRIVTLH